MSAHIVLGLGFGDEGKGLVTDYLAKEMEGALVVRFNGGHQAGHTVCLQGGHRHVFSNFGSGTLRGAATYWSRFCTIDPRAIVKEYELLKQNNPLLCIDPLCPVTTHYDIEHNWQQELREQHGSCGVGFGSTVRRHEETPYRLYAQDLLYLPLVKQKLAAIAAYYKSTLPKVTDELFLNDIRDLWQIADIEPIGARKGYPHFIFEGAQGILLDQDFGFFPHVTRSSTTAKNAIQLIKEWQIPSVPQLYYVTRAYQTRHGNGPMTNENLEFDLLVNSKETNIFNPWQKEFRKSVLDIDLLRHAIQVDDIFSYDCPKNIVITCVDQLKDGISYTDKGRCCLARSGLELADAIYPNAQHIFISSSPYSGNIIQVK